MAKNRECPKCAEVGHDKKKDHLFLMSDGKTWHCPKSYHEPYFERDGKAIAFSELGEETEVTMETIDVSELKPASIRGIPEDIIDKYGIRVECSTSTGEIIRHYYPITMKKGRHTVAWKRRILETKEFKVIPPVPGAKTIDLFGMKSSDMFPNTVVITEGELDACAAYYMMRGTYTRYMCLSLPFGNNLKSLLDARDWLEGVDDIIFCPDMDDPGREIIDKICLAFPKIRIAEYSEKDACDMLKEGKKFEFLNAIDHAKTKKPSTVVEVGDIFLEALKPIEWGASYPWEALTHMTYGCMNKSIIGIGAGPGAGKTSFVKAIQTHFVHENDMMIGIISLEETPAQTLRSLGGYVINKPVHLPDCKYDEESLKHAIDSFRGRVIIYNHSGYRDWKDIESTLLYMQHCGCRVAFIDPLSALVAHLSASDANTYLNNAMFTLSKMTQAMDLTVFHVNHLNNPSTGKDHGAGGAVYGSQFTGSRAMWKFSTDLWGLERDQLSEDERVRNTLKVKLIKSRLTGLSGSMYLQYDRARGQLVEVKAVGSFLGE